VVLLKINHERRDKNTYTGRDTKERKYMAIMRQAPVCQKCGEDIKGVYKNTSLGFVGDTFLYWNYEGHVCKPKEEKKVHHGHKWMPIMYVTYFGMLKEIAEQHGYCLSVHGSVNRDFDIICVPWVDTPFSHNQLLQAFSECVGISRSNGLPYDSMVEKPHGRISYTLNVGSGGYLDISIMPVILKERIK
jgi:hypothetical protein